MEEQAERPTADPVAASGPAERGRRPGLARILRLLCLSLGAGIVLALVQNWLLGDLDAAGLLGAELLVIGLVLRLNHLGLTEPAARLLALSLPVVATALQLTGTVGLRDVSMLMYPGAMVVAGLLLERHTLTALAALTIACVAVVTFFESGRPGGLGSADAAHYLVDASIILAVTAVGVGLVAEHLRRAVEGLRRGEAALVRANVALAEQAERLRASESRYRELIDLAADAIVVGDVEGRIVQVNDQARSLSGYGEEDLVGRTIDVLFSPEELAREPLRLDLLQHGQTIVRERRVRRPDGSAVPVEMSSKRMPDGSYQAILRDVSERKRAEAERAALEARLHQSQKMAAIGRLAGGVAHDFNNLLTAITGSLTLALRDVPPPARAHRWLKEVDAAAWRAATLTRQLLSFGQRQAVAPKVVDLRDLVRDLQPMLAQLVGERIRLETVLAPEPCPVSVDRVQFERVVLNLAANGRDAMRGGEGALGVDVRRAPPAQIHAARPDAAASPHVAITVSDTGCGMDAQVQEHLFEPFFTTKASGEGTGLGLAIVHAAVEQNRGWIEVASSPGRGATFRIYLPLATDGDSGPDVPSEGKEAVGRPA